MINEEQILTRLVELQEFDNQILDLEQEYYNIPSSLNDIKNKMDNLSGQVENLKKLLEEREVKLNSSQLEHQSLREKIKKYENQLMSVKTNKEYDAFLNEIETGNTKLKELDSDEMNLMEEVERLKEDVEHVEKERDVYKEEYSPILSELETKYETIKNDFTEKQKIRDEKIRELPKHVITKYEKIRKGADGRVVVNIIRESACGGCFQTFPKQKLNEIKRNKHLIVCEYCGRILYWKEK